MPKTSFDKNRRMGMRSKLHLTTVLKQVNIVDSDRIWVHFIMSH
jgi:hypothetical protein